jgi:hypothetical protein
MMEGKCYCCGKAGHKSTSSCLKDRPKEEWAINKAKKEQSHVNTKLKSNDRPSVTADNNQTHQTGWSGAHVQFYQASKMRQWILLDNQSTVILFCNPNLVENIIETDEELELSTNGADLHTKKAATVPGFGKVWEHPNAITNIFSFAEKEDKFNISYNSSK